ncbi:MAG: rhodanese-like domain-containing protein [Pyrinomonadaceae bacterium]
MRNITHNTLVFVFALAALVLGCQTASTTALDNAAGLINVPPAAEPTATPADDAPRVSLADAKAAFDAGTAYFIDTRQDTAYKAEHIKGAVNITSGTLESKLKEIPKNKKIIAYCS